MNSENFLVVLLKDRVLFYEQRKSGRRRIIEKKPIPESVVKSTNRNYDTPLWRDFSV
jgi:hypothetical protein